jgi:hypothetical protein
LWLKSFLSFFFLFVIVIFVLHFASFCFLHFQALAIFCNKCFTICEVPLKFMNLQNWLCIFLFLCFKVFVFYLWSFWFLRSFMCCWVLRLVQELLAYNYHGILKFPMHLSPPTFLFQGPSFSFVDFLLLKGSRLWSITICVSIVATFLNLTCLYAFATWASYFVEESFIKK